VGPQQVPRTEVQQPEVLHKLGTLRLQTHVFKDWRVIEKLQVFLCVSMG
jgi:hypothetical protein